MHVIKCNESEPTEQIEVKIGVCINVKYRYEPDLMEPHIYKFMGCVVTGATKRMAIVKLQNAMEAIS